MTHYRDTIHSHPLGMTHLPGTVTFIHAMLYRKHKAHVFCSGSGAEIQQTAPVADQSARVSDGEEEALTEVISYDILPATSVHAAMTYL